MEGLTAGSRWVRRNAATSALGLTLAWWATFFVWGTGGREPHVLSVASGLLLVTTLLVGPWRTLPLGVLALGNAVGLGAFVVVLTAPTGLAGGHEAASYAYAGQLGLLVLAWAATEARRTVLVVVLLAASGLQFAQGWLPWWALQDQTRLFQGTFYWHNQAGIFLAAGALVGFSAAASGQRPVAPLGWVVGPLSAAGVVYTTSRGSQLALVLGTLLILGAALATPGMRRGAVRLVGVAGLSWVLTQVLVGEPLFPERVSATASTAARAESFVSNGVQRFEDWRRAVAIFQEWPVTGAGFYSFDSATDLVTDRRDGVSTAFAHNGFLQAAADGGLVLAVPLLLALGAVLLAGVRGLAATLRAGDFVGLGGVVTMLVLLLHSGMDFDWTYPALLSLTALVAGLCVPLRTPAPVGAGGSPGARPAPPLARPAAPLARSAAAVLPVLLLLAAVLAAWSGGLDLNTPVT